MKGKTVYITGPLPVPGLNLAAFEEVAGVVSRSGGFATHPAALRLSNGWDVLGGNGEFDFCAQAERRADAVADADIILTLPDWADCPLARSDVALARILGVPIMPAPRGAGRALVSASNALALVASSSAFAVGAKALALVA